MTATFFLAVLLGVQDVPQVNKANFAHWRDFILPSQKDLAYKKIKWNYSLAQGISKARRTNKPILLWTMNGHPLSGCTWGNGTIGRQFVWSDPQVQKLSAQFVAVGDDWWHLKDGKDGESRFFQKIAAQGHYAHGDNKQGIYIFTVSGKLLASSNDNRPRLIADLLKKGLDKWNALPKSQRLRKGLSAGRGRAVYHGKDRYPTGGLVLRCSYRDLPRGHKFKGMKLWNEDFAWFTKQEVHIFRNRRPKVGETFGVPKVIINRLARFHLVDRVRGGASPFEAKHVKKAHLTARVLEVRRSVVSLELTGESHVAAEGQWRRGYKARLFGHAQYNVQQQKFISFQLVAAGNRWGKSQFNGRNDDPGPAPMGVAFTLARSSPAERLPPDLIWAYDMPRPR